jgi:hypothetical protein
MSDLLAHRVLEVLGEFLYVTAILAVPCFTIFAYRGWAKLRKESPQWRTLLGISSILATFISWLTFVGGFLVIALGLARFIESLVWVEVFIFMFTIGLLFVFALIGRSRVHPLGKFMHDLCFGEQHSVLTILADGWRALSPKAFEVAFVRAKRIS